MEITDSLVNSLQEMQSMLITSEDNTVKRVNNIHREFKGNDALIARMSLLLEQLTSQLAESPLVSSEITQTVRLCQLYINTLRENNASLCDDSSTYLKNMFEEHTLTIKTSSDVICQVLTGKSILNFLGTSIK